MLLLRPRGLPAAVGAWRITHTHIHPRRTHAGGIAAQPRAGVPDTLAILHDEPARCVSMVPVLCSRSMSCQGMRRVCACVRARAVRVLHDM